MPASPKVRYTYEDWLSIPEDRSRLYEVVDGELFVHPPPTFRHQEVAMRLSAILFRIADGYDLGKVVQSPIGVRLEKDSVLQPDVLFIAAERLHIVGSDGVLAGPPDLVVEVLSPSNRAHDRDLKRKRYLAGGVPQLWIVDPDQNTLEVWRSGPSEPERPRDAVTWRVGGHAFEIPLVEIFRA